MKKYEFPVWEAFSPDYVEGALPGLLEAAERDVAAIESSCPEGFEDFVWRLDDAMEDLLRCWHGVSHMLGVMNSQEWRDVQEKWQGRMVEFSLRVSQSRRLYEIAKSVLGRMPEKPTCGSDATRRRILEKMIEASEMSGVGLEGEKKARFNEIKSRLARLATDFSNDLIDATKAFSFEKDGKTYTIDDSAYLEAMKHCADREVREVLYRARAMRAEGNTARISEILALRRELAGLLGYANYAEKSIAEKCAPSVAAVFKMIDDLDAATVSRAAEETEAIGGDSVLPWDVAYEAERLRERTYSYSEEELKRHFEIDAVLDGLFAIADFLFGVKVEEVPESERPDVWHEDVRFFSVSEGGEVVAHFYLDPYVRPGLKSGGAWMNEFSNRCDRRGKKPLAVVVANFQRPGDDGKSLLTMREVETVYHEFGHALQCMLTRVGEEGAAGLNLVEWDAVEVASQFMENWCLDDRTGVKIPAELKAKVRAAKNFRAASKCRRQLALTKTDLELHVRETADPDAVKTAVFRHFGVPFIPGDLFLCSFLHIFAGGYAAGYYGYKWAEVMSADCYGAFEEAGLGDDEAMRGLGRRYRETILALGGSKSALDVFRDFRGRDPEISAILRQSDLV